MSIQMMVRPNQIRPGDVLDDGTTVAKIALPESPAVVATINLTNGNLRFCGIEAQMMVTRSVPG